MLPVQVVLQLTHAPGCTRAAALLLPAGMVSVVQLTAPTQVSTAHGIGMHRCACSYMMRAAQCSTSAGVPLRVVGCVVCCLV